MRRPAPPQLFEQGAQLPVRHTPTGSPPRIVGLATGGGGWISLVDGSSKGTTNTDSAVGRNPGNSLGGVVPSASVAAVVGDVVVEGTVVGGAVVGGAVVNVRGAAIGAIDGVVGVGMVGAVGVVVGVVDGVVDVDTVVVGGSVVDGGRVGQSARWHVCRWMGRSLAGHDAGSMTVPFSKRQTTMRLTWPGPHDAEHYHGATIKTGDAKETITIRFPADQLK